MLAHSCRRGDGLTRIEVRGCYVLNLMVSAKQGAEDVICENGAEAVVAAMRGHKKAISVVGVQHFSQEAAKNAVHTLGSWQASRDAIKAGVATTRGRGAAHNK